MELKNGIWLTCKRDGTVWSNLSGQWQQETDNNAIHLCKALAKIMRSHRLNDVQKSILTDKYIEQYQKMFNIEAEQTTSSEDKRQAMRDVCCDLIDFFKDFNFEPNFRFVNTLKKNSASVDSARAYICNYFSLTDSQFKDDVAEKTRSQEFKNIIRKLQNVSTKTTINHRFKVYYGSQGTGKTTKALEETSNVVMVCHSAMLPSDLLEDFKFEEGKPAFKKSALWEAMENGTKITLDEINLLPFESLRFLQSILDNKTEINYKGQIIHIKDGFQIIGTMNLTVNGNVFNLPEPLVDRACELQEFRLTADNLMGALE